MSKNSLLKFESKRLDSTSLCRNKDLLDEIFPPREFYDRHQHRYIQCVSREPATIFDVKLLEKLLDENLKSSRATEIGLCPDRRRLYDECFAELVRQVTIECGERGIILSRIRKYFHQLINQFDETYRSACAYAMRTFLLNEQKKFYLTHQIDRLEFDLEQLREQLTNAEDHFEHVTNLYSRWKYSIEDRRYPSMSNVIPFELEQLRRTHDSLKEELQEILTEKCHRRLFDMMK